jgi:hypothetical protein
MYKGYLLTEIKSNIYNICTVLLQRTAFGCNPEIYSVKRLSNAFRSASKLMNCTVQ